MINKEKKIYIFCQQIYNLMESSFSLVDSLDLVSKSEKNHLIKHIVFRLKNDLLKGLSVYQAFERHRNFFGKEFVAILRVGEEGANIKKAFKDLLAIYEAKINARQKFVSVMIYPCIVILMMFSLIYFVIESILPNFIDIYASDDIRLPAVTEKLIFIYRMRYRIIFFIFLILISLIFARRYINSNKKLKLKKDEILLKIPYFGKIIAYNEAGRIYFNISSLMQAGLSLSMVFEIVCEQIKNSYIEKKLERAIKNIEAGASFSENFIALGITPPNYENLLRVASETAKLSEELQKIASLIEKDGETRKKIFLSMLEPGIILILGTILAFVLVAIYLPIININNYM